MIHTVHSLCTCFSPAIGTVGISPKLPFSPWTMCQPFLLLNHDVLSTLRFVNFFLSFCFLLKWRRSLSAHCWLSKFWFWTTPLSRCANWHSEIAQTVVQLSVKWRCGVFFHLWIRRSAGAFSVQIGFLCGRSALSLKGNNYILVTWDWTILGTIQRKAFSMKFCLLTHPSLLRWKVRISAPNNKIYFWLV